MPNLTLQDETTVIDLTGVTAFSSKNSVASKTGAIYVYAKGIGRRVPLLSFRRLHKAARAVRDLSRYVITDGIDVKVSDEGFIVPDA